MFTWDFALNHFFPSNPWTRQFGFWLTHLCTQRNPLCWCSSCLQDRLRAQCRTHRGLKQRWTSSVYPFCFITCKRWFLGSKLSVQYLCKCYYGTSILLHTPRTVHFLVLNIYCRNLDSCAPEPLTDNTAKPPAAGSCAASTLPSVTSGQKIKLFISS